MFQLRTNYSLKIFFKLTVTRVTNVSVNWNILVSESSKSLMQPSRSTFHARGYFISTVMRLSIVGRARRHSPVSRNVVLNLLLSLKASTKILFESCR